jgi:lysophospholipase L1-like esterase
MRVLTSQLATAKRPYLFLPDGWDTGWKAAKAAQGQTPAWVGFIGDSIMQGFNSSDQMLKSFARLIRAGLLGSATPYADFFAPVYSSGTGAPVAIVNGGSGTGGFGGQNQSSNLAMAVTLTSPYPCTQIDLWVKQTVAGTWQYAVDGGGANTVTNNPTNFFVTRTPITGLTSANHTVVLNNQSLANVLTFCGASFYPAGSGGTGLGFVHNGINGIALSSFNWTFGIPEGWAGRNAHQGATYAPVFPQAPHLVILELGVNDCNTANSSPEVYRQYLKSWCHQFRRGRPGCSILFLVPCYPDTEASDTTNTFANQHTWIYYVEAMYSVARMLNCAVANIHAKWGETPQGSGFISGGSSVHPTDAGHADIANLLLGVL